MVRAMQIDATTNNINALKELGTRLKNIRISQNLTQAELADKSGVALKTITRAEQGENIALDKILNLLRALNLLANINQLLPEPDIKPAESCNSPKTKDKQRSRVRKSETKPLSNWIWGDEK